MSDFDDFVKKNPPTGKKSKLDDFAEEIFALRKLGYSEKDILRFLLEKKGLSATQPTLNRFLRRKQTNRTPQKNELAPVQTPPEDARAPLPHPAANKSSETGGQSENEERLPKFDWNPGNFNIDNFVG